MAEDNLVKQLDAFSGGDSHKLLDADNPKGRPPTEEELQHTHAAPGRKAMLPIGIAYHGPWKFYADGMGKHTREQVRALAATGLPVRLQSIGQPKFLNEELHEDVRKVEYLERVSFSHTALAIKQFVFHSLSFLQEMICPTSLRSHASAADVAKHTIVYTSWERDRVYPQIIDELQQVGRVWVPCEMNRMAFVNSGLPESKVDVIPYPYDPASCTIAAPRGREDVPVGRRYYHIGKWEPRKNQHQLLGAFLLAHTPKSRASLVIKTSGFGSTWANYPTAEESVRFWLDDPRVRERGWTSEHLDRLVRIIYDRISEEDIQRLHEKNNIYISSGLGEAWDIPAFEARLAGNRIVAVGFGGPSEYMSEDDVLVKRSIGPVHSQYDWEPDAQWARVATEDMAKAMKLAEPPKFRMVPPELCQLFSHYAVGRRMALSIKQVLIEIGGIELVNRVFPVGGFG